MLDKFRTIARGAANRRQFHPAARSAVLLARSEASRAGQDQIHSEHVLLGLLSVPGPAAEALAAAGVQLTDVRRLVPRGNGPDSGGLDSDALSSVGIDLDAIRRATDAAFGPGALDRAGPARPRRMPFGHDARQVIVGAAHAADALGQREISSGHLLLGVIDKEPGLAASVLTVAGADLAALRADVLRRITPAA